MPEGLTIWDANGVVVHDTNDIVFKVLGVVDTGTAPATGSVSDARMVGKSIFVIVSHAYNRYYISRVATVTSNSGTGSVSWTLPFSGSSASLNVPSKIIYGVI